MIEIENVTISRDGQTILRKVDARLEAGKIHAVIGPNGTGKTTLLQALFDELSIDKGHIRLGDKCLSPGRPGMRTNRRWRDHFAYMPQDTTADIALSVLEVVVLGRLGKLALHIDDEVLDLAMDRLSRAGIAHLAGRDIASLSGGQRQMALFAQVLMREPEVMLLDEPVSALDLRHQVSLLELVRRETQSNGWVTVIVLHDLNLACQYADNLLIFGDGELQHQGSPLALVTPDIIRKTYGVEVEVLFDTAGNPVIQPISKARGFLDNGKEGLN